MTITSRRTNNDDEDAMGETDEWVAEADWLANGKVTEEEGS